MTSAATGSATFPQVLVTGPGTEVGPVRHGETAGATLRHTPPR